MSILFDKKSGLVRLLTSKTEYQLKIGDHGYVLHTYYGAGTYGMDMSYLIKEMDRGFSGNSYECRDRRGFSPDTLPFEYSTEGAGDFRTNALGIVSANGSRTCDLRYKGHRIYDGIYTIDNMPYVRSSTEGEADYSSIKEVSEEGSDNPESTLELILEDSVLGLEVTLIYKVFEDKDIIVRSSRITNTSSDIVTLTKASSMSVDLLHKDMDYIHFHGRHAMERQPERRRLSHDIQAVRSKRGASSHHNNPFVILCDKDATEDSGECYGFMLMYSGNHLEEIEVDQAGSIRVTAGIGSEYFNWKLGASESFQTPEVIMAYSDSGLNDLSYLYHRIIRQNVCPREFRDVKRPVLINNWEGTYFNFDEKKIMEIQDAAADLGCEMFVLDDGWFGARNDDNAGLGDWFVNTKKLPGSIKAIADHANSLNMKFGLWFEPEMVNEDSDLYRNHPDWALTDEGRKPVMGRNQLVLDMSRKEVVDYLYDKISKILDRAHVEYIKWDFNRSVANVFSRNLPADRQGEVAHRFVLGSYDLMNRLRTNYPDVMIEGCSGGGGRFDAGIMFYSPQIWCSDNSEAIDRLKIQKGTSYGYPVSTMGAHVSACPNHQNGRVTSIGTRGIVAMSGTFGYELDPRSLSDSDKNIIRQQIKDFNRFYFLIQKGRYYRLTDDAREDYFVSWEFVSEDKSEALVSLVMVSVHGNPVIPHIKLKGLDGDASYKVDYFKSSIEEKPEEAGIKESDFVGRTFTGGALMNGGFAFDPLYGVYPAVQVHLTRA